MDGMEPILFATALLAFARCAEQVPRASPPTRWAHGNSSPATCLKGAVHRAEDSTLPPSNSRRVREYGFGPSGRRQLLPGTTYEARRSTTEGEVRNVIGVLPGSYLTFKDSYVPVTAHYDHLGMRKKDNPEASEDLLFKGATTMVAAQAAIMECAPDLRRDEAEAQAKHRVHVLLGRGRRFLGQRLLRPAPGLSPGEDRCVDQP